MPAGWKLRERMSFAEAQADQAKMRQDSEVLPQRTGFSSVTIRVLFPAPPKYKAPLWEAPTSDPIAQPQRG